MALDLASRGSIEEAGTEAVIARVGAIEPDLVFATDDELALLPAGAGALAPIVVVKLGPRGAVLQGAVEAERRSLPGVVTDTLGAGDALAGGMLAALASGTGFIEALERGLVAASVCVARRGAMPAVYSAHADVAQLVERRLPKP